MSLSGVRPIVLVEAEAAPKSTCPRTVLCFRPGAPAAAGWASATGFGSGVAGLPLLETTGIAPVPAFAARAGAGSGEAARPSEAAAAGRGDAPGSSAAGFDIT